VVYAWLAYQIGLGQRGTGMCYISAKSILYTGRECVISQQKVYYTPRMPYFLSSDEVGLMRRGRVIFRNFKWGGV